MTTPPRTSFSARFCTAKEYTRILIERIQQDRLTMVAGHLAYVSLLSLVPLITVVFALLSIFPVFADISGQLKNFIFHNFIPTSSETILAYLETFAKNSHRMTAVGTTGLIITALLLIAAVDEALNHIWRSKNKRPVVFSFAVYWMVLTLGPVLAGASMAISTYLLSLRWLNEHGVYNYLDQILRVFPLLLSFLTFWLVFSVVPTVRVRARDAAAGALVAGLLFEFGKKLFSLYVEMFPSYQLIYGVIAVIPILFIWVYFSWCIVLLGAEVTAALGEYRLLRQKRGVGLEEPILSKKRTL